MYTHAPENHKCWFCDLIQNSASAGNQLTQSDIIFQDENVTALVAVRRWANNPGHVLVIPNHHFENIFDLPLEIAPEIHTVAKNIARAMKLALGCDGVMLRQHNEPAGGQHILHYHLHVIPRFTDDNFQTSTKEPFLVQDRATLAKKLANILDSHPQKN